MALPGRETVRGSFSPRHRFATRLLVAWLPVGFLYEDSPEKLAPSSSVLFALGDFVPNSALAAENAYTIFMFLDPPFTRKGRTMHLMVI